MKKNQEDIADKIVIQCKKAKTLPAIFSLVPNYSKKEIKRTIEHLLTTGKLKRVEKNKYVSVENTTIIKGRFIKNPKGYGFVAPEIKLNNGRDIFIPEKFTKNAWNNDEVLVKLIKTRFKKDKKGERQEGEVFQIVKRSNENIMGTIAFNNEKPFLQPKNKSLPMISINKMPREDVGTQDLVAVKVTSYGDKPKGNVVAVFGKSDSMIAQENSILFKNGIYEEFPPMVKIQTEGVPKQLEQEQGRLDLTKDMIFTIDGELSKDFDDAISLQPLDNGNYKLGVHIADVSHYVTEGSPLDLEAFDRGTSVYFANKVVPMLPFELSSGICSLNPNENRFAMTVFLELDSNAQVVNKSFHKSIIKSKYRLTYSKVNKILEKDEELCKQYEEITKTLEKMNEFAMKMEKKRLNRGYLDLNISESYMITDENGEPIDIKIRNRSHSEKLIEQFMVLANESVAEYMEINEFPAVYRVHEPPNIEKLEVFADVVRMFGYSIANDQLKNPLAIQSVLNQCLDKPNSKTVSKMLLRSLSRARYSEQCIGHNGLASEYYLHFTSPIRRYPDLVVHRMLSKKIANQNFEKQDFDFVEIASIQSTQREKMADEASRDIEKLYFARYMEKFIGDRFEATVSGVQTFGIFVELENGIEGLVRIEKLANKGYVYDERLMKITANNKEYTIGTPLSVVLINASSINGQIDFEI